MIHYAHGVLRGARGSTHGLSSGSDELNWRLRGKCAEPGRNPDWWLPEGKLTRENKEAIRLCGLCPVRVRCRDEALAADHQSQVIAGGWWWKRLWKTRPVPFPGDEALMPARRDGPEGGPATPSSGRGGWRRGGAVSSSKVIAAGRAVLGGESPEDVSARLRLSRETVRKGVRLARLADQDMIDAVLAGRTSFDAAYKLLAGQPDPAGRVR